MESRLYYDELDTSIGKISFLSDGTSVLRIDFENTKANHDKWQKWLKRYFGEVTLIPSIIPFTTVKKELQAYFKGELKEFSFRLKPLGTTFQKQVWDALLMEIPYGETKSYQDVAATIGNSKAVRAIGGAVNKNPLSIVIPCHRVIGANGQLIGYGGGLDRKEFLLKLEKQRRYVSDERP